MRIIGGLRKGALLQVPANIPTRPTTDRSKEGLFNILENMHDLDQCRVLDLFSGTGSISLEFASRGAPSVVAVDRHAVCARHLRESSQKLELEAIEMVQAQVMPFLYNTAGPFDIIFSDPPYDIFDRYEEMIDLVFERGLLDSKGTLAVEHYRSRNFEKHPRFFRSKAYGQNVISFFDYHFSNKG
jgi:16S rRNA (guanine(966)-N(2))-methyltransferase RsmD